MTRAWWMIKSPYPYNRIGKHALQDVYSCATSGNVNYKILYGKKGNLDHIGIAKVR